MLDAAPENSGLALSERETFSDALEAIAERRCKKSFTLLFEYYAPRIKSYLLRLGCESLQAEELAQEVMITVWRKAEQFDRKQASPATWLFRIARNRRIDAFRRTKTLDAQADEPVLSPAELPQPEEQMQLIQTEVAVQDALKTLPEDQLVLLKAAFFEGKTHSEISTEYKLPLGTVKSRIRLAFERLRTTLRSKMN